MRRTWLGVLIVALVGAGWSGFRYRQVIVREEARLPVQFLRLAQSITRSL